MKSKCSSALAFGLAAWLGTSDAMEPPNPGDYERYTRDGSLNQRLDNAMDIGNDMMSPRLLYNFARTRNLLPEGFAPPPDWQGGLPASGSPKVPVILVEFPDYPKDAVNTSTSVAAKFFGSGNAADAPYESLRNYYRRASYGTLDIQGNVLGWYRAQHNRSYYQNLGSGPGQEALMIEALDYYSAQGHNFAQYDNDNNGVIDSLFLKWTGPDNGWANFWWAYQWGWHSYPNYTVNGKHLGQYVWSWIARPVGGTFMPPVDIHETGHLLGLPDYYDYEPGIGPNGGVGHLDMMDGNWGDHNAFSKAMLGWINPTVIASGAQTKALNPSGSSAEAVLIMPNSNGNIFSEFFMAQYRKRSVANDPANYPTDGLVVWHVDARLNTAGTNFQYDNSRTAHKLLRLMEADGLEEIETDSGIVNAGDFYVSPKSFTPATNPDSSRYDGSDTNVSISGLSAAATSLTATFSVGSAAGPAAPEGLTATPASASQINLAWQDKSSNETGFRIERKTGATGSWAQVATTAANVSTYSNTGLAAATTYYYRVRAYNAAGDSGYSNEVSAMTQSGAGCISAMAIPGSLGGTWASGCASTHRSGSYARYYTFTLPASQLVTITLSSPTDAYLYLLSGSGTSGAILYQDDDSGGSYNSRVSATLGAGNYTIEATTYAAAQSGSFTLAVQTAALPGTPSALTATAASATQANLNWTDNSTNETGFKIERRTGTAGSWSQITMVGANVTSFSDPGLAAATTYGYRVRAYNASGDSAYSNEATVTTPNGACVAPITVPGNLGGTWVTSCNSTHRSGRYAKYYTFTLASAQAVIVSLNSPVDSYVFLLSGAGTNGSVLGQNDDSNGTLNSQLTMALGAGSYTIEATTYSATMVGNFTVAIQGGSAPTAPTALAAAPVAPTQVNLTWQDNSTNETGFRIERKTGSTGTWALIASPAANATSYSDASGLAAATTYYYRVRAYNVAGESVNSAEVAATTPAASACNLGITVGQSLPGAWVSGCAATHRSRTYARFYTFTLAGSQAVTVDLTSTQDTYLFLLSGATSTGTVLGSNDDYGGTLNSHLAMTLGAGTYTIEATTFSAGVTGTFNLSLQGTSGVPVAPSYLLAAAASGGRIDLSWTDNSNNETGFRIERKTGASGTWGEIGTAGANVRTFANTGLSPTLTYYYRVRAYNAAGNSGYSNEAAAMAMGNCLASIAAGQTLAGTWTADCPATHRSNSYAKYYTFTVTSSRTVTIDLTSATDTYLYLLVGAGTAGSVAAQNDDYGGTYNSHVSLTLGVGTYTIEATTYSSARTGSFNVQLQ